MLYKSHQNATKNEVLRGSLFLVAFYITFSLRRLSAPEHLSQVRVDRDFARRHAPSLPPSLGSESVIGHASLLPPQLTRDGGERGRLTACLHQKPPPRRPALIWPNGWKKREGRSVGFVRPIVWPVTRFIAFVRPIGGLSG